jgi:glutaminase
MGMVLELGSQFCVCIWQQTGFIHRQGVSNLMYFVEKFYKVCTFSVVCKDYAVASCFTLEHKEGSTLTGHTMLV